MPRKLRWKWTFIVLVLLGSLAGIFQLPTSKQELFINLGRNIRLGLDLKGGTHIVLQVQEQDAFKLLADRAVERLGERLKADGIPVGAIDRSEPVSPESADSIQITLTGVPAQHVPALRRTAADVLGQDWTVVREDSGILCFGIRADAASRLRRDTVAQSMRVVERRVNGLGISETSVQQRGGSERSNEIILQLPGVNDPAHIKGIVQTTAMLEFAGVVEGPFPSLEDARSALESNHGARIIRGAQAGGNGEAWWLVSRSPVVTGNDLRDARVEPGENPGSWDTGFLLTTDAAARFERFTERNIGKRLAVVLDDRVLSAPRIENRISGRGRIAGAPTLQDASDLALNLRAGALPAGLKILEERTVGPSLGSDSIHRGVTAGLTGLALVVASMAAYYRGAGLNAVFALFLNTIITVSALSYLGAAWTLPGVAGLVLSIGMAVDSNVLIFERIKEELRAGRPVGPAVFAGFRRALGTLVDTHVTTVTASAFLFMFGTGPVRGFAVTLVIGLAANLFTAVFVSKAAFELQLWRRPKPHRLSIGSVQDDFFGSRGIDFMRRRALAVGLSIVLVVAGLLAIGGYGLKPGIDFRGGVLVHARISGSPPIEEVRKALAGGLEGEATVQQTEGPGGFLIGAGLASEENLSETRGKVEQALQRSFQSQGKNVELLSAETVGPRAGAFLRGQALTATLGALAGMLVYIALRFQWIAGVAAVLATLHDVIVTLGLFAWTGREIDLNIIAALLTLIGYSMNDKVVLFDRVRENERSGKRPGSFLELVNNSINQTLSRTLLTAGPTILACLALYFLGGPVLNGIAFALLAGIAAGTYSSIFVAGSVLALGKRRQQSVADLR
jgi:protein-export membrane protein SecD/preprotein translocase SecF subunit